MKWTKKIFGFICLFLLTSCMAKPVLTVKSADVSMKLTQSAPWVWQVAFSPDGKYVLTGDVESVTLWDMSSGTAAKKLMAPEHLLNGIPVAFSQDGLYGITGGKGLKIWDLSTRKKVRSIGDRRIMSISVSPDKKSVLAGGPQDGPLINSHISLWDMNTGNEVKEFNIPTPPLIGPQLFLRRVTLSPDGRYALSGHSNGRMILWDVSMGSKISSVDADRGYPSEVRSVAFSSNGKYALSGGADGTVKLWNIPSLSLVKEFKGHAGLGIGAVAFSPDARYALLHNSRFIFFL